jgi:hypothetical protein
MQGIRSVNASVHCSVCKKPIRGDMREAMWIWGVDLEKNPLMLVHFECDLKTGWQYSMNFESTWRCLNRKCFKGKQFPLRYT